MSLQVCARRNFDESCEESPNGLLRWGRTARSLARYQSRSRRNLPVRRRARGCLRSRHHRPRRHSCRFPRRCPRLCCPAAELHTSLSPTLATPALVAAGIAGPAPPSPLPWLTPSPCPCTGRRPRSPPRCEDGRPWPPSPPPSSLRRPHCRHLSLCRRRRSPLAAALTAAALAATLAAAALATGSLGATALASTTLAARRHRRRPL